MLLATTLLMAAMAHAQTPCDFVNTVDPGQVFYIFSPQYPAFYFRGAQCRWKLTTTAESIILMSCEDFNIPASQGCTDDRFSVSPTGDATLSDAKFYCGKGSFNISSTTNQMLITLRAPYFSAGGRFMCSITAAPVTPPTPPPTCACGWKKETRIVGGNNTGVNEYPMMAGIVDFQIRDLFCGASIISDRYFITAAHCMMKKQPENLGVLVGDWNITTGSDTNTSRIYRVESFMSHPQYNLITHHNDICILRSSEVIRFSLEVGPVCLPWSLLGSFAGDYVNLLGWGTTYYGGPTSDTLQYVAVGVLSNDQCKKSMHDENQIISSQMCTYWPGKDACQSDSGGPALWQSPRNSRVFLLGIISFGIGCAQEQPGINTRVTSFLNWIAQVTPDAQYCVV